MTEIALPLDVIKQRRDINNSRIISRAVYRLTHHGEIDFDTSWHLPNAPSRTQREVVHTKRTLNAIALCRQYGEMGCHFPHFSERPQ